MARQLPQGSMMSSNLGPVVNPALLRIFGFPVRVELGLLLDTGTLAVADARWNDRFAKREGASQSAPCTHARPRERRCTPRQSGG